MRTRKSDPANAARFSRRLDQIDDYWAALDQAADKIGDSAVTPAINNCAAAAIGALVGGLLVVLLSIAVGGCAGLPEGPYSVSTPNLDLTYTPPSKVATEGSEEPTGDR